MEMPFHMAIFDANTAGEVMAQFPEIDHWYHVVLLGQVDASVCSNVLP